MTVRVNSDCFLNSITHVRFWISTNQNIFDWGFCVCVCVCVRLYIVVKFVTQYV